MQEYLQLLLNGVDQVGVWFIIPFLVLENIPIVGLFAPGLTVLVLSGFFYEALTGNYLSLFLIAWLVIFLADTTWFMIGYLGQQRTAWLQKLASQAPDVGEILGKQSKLALLNYQFIPYFRMFLPFALGLYRFSPLWWLLLCFVGSGLYTGVFLGIGVLGVTLLGGIEQIETITTNLNRFLAVFALVYGFFLYRKYVQLQANNKKDLG